MTPEIVYSNPIYCQTAAENQISSKPQNEGDESFNGWVSDDMEIWSADDDNIVDLEFSECPLCGIHLYVRNDTWGFFPILFHLSFLYIPL